MPRTSDNVSTKTTTHRPNNLPSLHLEEHTSTEAVSQASQLSASDFCLPHLFWIPRLLGAQVNAYSRASWSLGHPSRHLELELEFPSSFLPDETLLYNGYQSAQRKEHSPSLFPGLHVDLTWRYDRSRTMVLGALSASLIEICMHSLLMRTSYKAPASSSDDTTNLLDRISSKDALFGSTRTHHEEMSSSLNLSTTRCAAAYSLVFFSLPRVCSSPLGSWRPSTTSLPILFSSSAVVRRRHLQVLSPFFPAFRALVNCV